MGSVRRVLCTGVLAATALTSAAYAADGAGGAAVTPATPAPGADVTLEVAECAERTAVAVSSAFVSEARLTVADGVLVGDRRGHPGPPRDGFDARQAYGPRRSGRAELRLVTCGGSLDEARHRHTANVIVSAYPTDTTTA